MTAAKTQKQFRAAWDEHIDGLARLGFSLPVEHLERLTDSITNLRLLVGVAVNETYKKDGAK